jgi:hypothetical protein
MIGCNFCDSEKAFDCVNYDILLSKLRFCGIRWKAYSVIKSYLKDRHQIVNWKDNYNNHITYSNWGKIKHGVRNQYLDLCFSYLH